METKSQLTFTDIMNDGWRYIEGSDDAYANLDGKIKRHGKIINEQKVDEGYLRCTVGGKVGRKYSHILVANTWLDNPLNLPVVDHLNHDKSDNRVCNLEFVTHKENSLRCGATGALGRHETLPIRAIRLSDKKEMVFDNQSECGKALGINPKDINKQLRGKRNTSHGYKFEYIYTDNQSEEYIQMELIGYQQWLEGRFPDDEYGVFYSDLEERNNNIYDLRQSGLSYRVIAEKFGITIERVRQICAKTERMRIENANEIYLFAIKCGKSRSVARKIFLNLKRLSIIDVDGVKNLNPEEFGKMRNVGVEQVNILRKMQETLKNG